MDSFSLEEQFWNSLSLAVETPSPRSVASLDGDEQPPQRRVLPSMSPAGRKVRKNWGSRKSQRYLNDTFLGTPSNRKKPRKAPVGDETNEQNEKEDEDSEEEIDQLFEWKSTFACLVQPYSPQSRAWEPFIDIKEEQQTALLRKISTGSQKNVNLSTSVPSQFHHPQIRKRSNIPRLDRHTKRLLQKSVDSPIVQRLEICLSHFAGEKDQPEQDLNFGFRHETVQNNGLLLIYFEDDPTGFQRLLAHAVSTFFALNSKSEIDENQEKFVLIQRTQKTQIPPISLTRYISLSITDPSHISL